MCDTGELIVMIFFLFIFPDLLGRKSEVIKDTSPL